MVAARIAGRIINVTTIGAARTALHGNAAYAAARAGVTMLGRSAALEYASNGILVNTVLCGAINGHVRFDEQTQEWLEAGGKLEGPLMEPGRLPLGYGTMNQLAAAVLYLAGPAGSYITGQELIIDGGFSVT
jgi:NAD(P)-dependent dehydrogenase (short-subunit alcohol dehydrogenase family)